MENSLRNEGWTTKVKGLLTISSSDSHIACSQEQKVDFGLALLDQSASIVDVLERSRVTLDKVALATNTG